MAWWDTPKKGYRFKLLRDERLNDLIVTTNVRTQPIARISVYNDGCFGTQLVLETEKKIVMTAPPDLGKAKTLSDIALALADVYREGHKKGKTEEEERGRLLTRNLYPDP